MHKQNWMLREQREVSSLHKSLILLSFLLIPPLLFSLSLPYTSFSGFPAGATVSAVARIDGAEVFRRDFTIDNHGKCLVSFDLPKRIFFYEGRARRERREERGGNMTLLNLFLSK